MPELCRFHGIIIRMYHDDHNPPHFHAVYGGDEAAIGIDRLDVLEGRLPRRAMSLVTEWAKLHQRELHQAWHRLEQDRSPGKIAPLP